MSERNNHLVRTAIVLMLTMLTTATAWAGQVTEAEAREKAQAFLTGRGLTQGVLQRELRMAGKGRRMAASANRPDADATTICDYYLFNVGSDAGFIIISGDDRAVDVLGYADSGSISEDRMPDGLRYMLDCYAEQMAWLDEGDYEANASSSAAARTFKAAMVRTAISPLVATRWDQEFPYSNNCPELVKDEKTEKTVTGCVATSMAQLMYYHRWPVDACAIIPGYTTRNKLFTTTDLSATHFQWDNMTTTYEEKSTNTVAEAAVAELMQYCGWSIQMNYNVVSTGGSSAYNASITEALKDYFDYDGGIQTAFRKNYTYAEWVDLIYRELAANRPVILGGQSAGGGHSFVCDGYNADDYFHINWGWGGGGDGYFRLSALNPYTQGAGGSSTLDGFSFDQDAIIGIQKPVSGNRDYCLSLEGLRLNSSDKSDNTKVSKTFTRTASTDAFTDISLATTLCSYRFGTNTFDIALWLVDGDDNRVATFKEISKQMTFNKNESPELSSSIPASVADGTYYLKVMSRPYVSEATDETNPWQECFSGDQYRLTAVISDNSLTISVPRPENTVPTAVTFTVTGNLQVGFEQEVTASITGGAAAYHGDVILRVNNKAVMGKTIDVEAGQTVDAHFVYTPSTAGNNSLSLWTHKTSGSQIGASTTITIASSNADNTQELTIVPVVKNLDAGGKLYGNAMRVTATFKNPSTTNSYVGKVNCSLRMYNNETDDKDNIADATVKSQNITIPVSTDAEPLSSTDVDFAFDGLDPTKFYRMRFSYTQGYYDNGKKKTRTAAGLVTDIYTVGGGFAVYNADGTTTISPSASEINASSATFVDLSAIDDLSTVSITKSKNPNCIYQLPDNTSTSRGTANTTSTTTPSALEGCNIVRGNTAETLVLNDNYDFYTPVSFTANSVSYTRTFTLAANGTSGWNTIMLPFAPTSITVRQVDGENVTVKPVDWFHSAADTGKNFWLRTFAADGTGTVAFDYASEFEAYTPYIIAVPDDRWGKDWQMTGYEVTFSASTATIAASSVGGELQFPSLGGNHYKFFGTTIKKALSEGYVLNDAGSSFENVAGSSPARSAQAFRAWFSPISISSLSLPALSIGRPQTLGIEDMRLDSNPSASSHLQGNGWYDLSGRQLDSRSTPGSLLPQGRKKPTAKGIYIHNGRKVVIK